MDDNGPLNGSSFSGSVTYDTNAAIVLTGANFRDFALATGALTVTIGGDTVHNTNSNVNVPDIIEVSNFGRIVFESNTVAESGPLDGFNAFPRFEFSGDPDLAALELPFPFPTDFSDPRLAVNSGGGGQLRPHHGVFRREHPVCPGTQRGRPLRYREPRRTTDLIGRARSAAGRTPLPE